MRVSLRRATLGMLVAAVVGAPILYIHESPLLPRLPDGYWLFLHGSCPATRSSADLVRATPHLRSQVLLVPTDPNDLLCADLRAQLRQRWHWLGWLPQRYLCRRIGREAAHFVELNHVASPAWALDGRAISPDRNPMLELESIQ